MRRFLICSLLLAFLASMGLTGCNTPSAPASAGTSAPVATSATSAEATPEAEPSKPAWQHEKYDPNITITMNLPLSQLLIEQIPEGYTVEENDYTAWAKETLGIVYKSKWVSSSAEANSQKLNLAIVSNDLPDIIKCTGKDLATLVKAGLVLPLNDLIDTYASPLTESFLNDFEQQTQGMFYAPYTFDKKIYGIPTLADVWAVTWTSNWIRKDILSELNKGLPTTLEELEAILAAYHEKYPGGVGHVLSVDSNMITGIQTVMEAYGAYPGKWIEGGDGKLAYGSIQPEVKKGLETLKKWYANGWLDKEFVVKDSAKAYEPYTAGNGLSMTGMWWLVWSPFPDLLKNVEQAELVAYPPLKNAGGKSVSMLQNAFSSNSEVTAISAKLKNPEAVILQLNENMDSQFRSDKALREKMKTEYNYEFRYPYTEYQTPKNPEALPGAYEYEYEVPGAGYFNHAGGVQIYCVQVNQRATELVDQYLRIVAADKAGTFDQLSQLDKDEKGKYLSISEKRWPALASSVELWNGLNNNGGLLYDKFAGAPTKTMIDKNAYLQKLEMEAFATIIMDEKPLEYFDEFVKEWEKAGGSDITSEVNDWSQNIG